MGPSRDAVKVLRWAAALLALCATWLTFASSSTTLATQVAPDTVRVVAPPVSCSAAEKASDPALCRSRPVTNLTPGATALVSFTCSTIWQQWGARSSYTAADGTAYGSLSGRWTPTARIYDAGAVLQSANATCLSQNQGRARVFWMLVILAPAALLAAEAMRRGTTRRRPWSSWPTTAASGPDQSI